MESLISRARITMLPIRPLKHSALLLLFLFFCLPLQVSAEIWVFFRNDIPLHMDTIQHLKQVTKQRLVFCPVGKTSFSFLESQSPEFVVVLGDAALKLALQMMWKVKILVTLTDQPSEDSRTIFLDTQQPYALQLKLLKSLLPEIDSIWYPYASERFAPSNDLEKAAAAAGTKITANRLNDPRTLPAALRSINQRNSAVILPPDPGIMNNAVIQAIFLATFRSHIPVISFSETLVKQGAAFAYVLSPENLAASIAEIIDEEISRSGTHKPVRAFNKWNLIVNKTILEKLKLPFSDQLKKAVSKFY